NGAVASTEVNGLGSPGADINVSDGAALVVDPNSPGTTTLVTHNVHIIGTGIANAGAIEKMGTSVTFNGGITLDGNARINSDAGVLTIGAAVTAGGDFNLTLGGAGSINATSGIAIGHGTVTKDGSGVASFNAGSAFDHLVING